MATKPSAKTKAWAIFDRIVSLAALDGVHSNPWTAGPDGAVRYNPDYDTLVKLLGVPLYLKAPTQSGVPALALDVWLSYEFRRAGFDHDAIWPRAVHPRVLPGPVARLLRALPQGEQSRLAERLTKSSAVPGVTSSSANILGKNYLKQVDVIMSDWATGPELLISTKRMDSSYGKNAPNRVEESYGDAKNLRLRHPLAALGFVLGLRSDILQKEPETAKWLFDLVGKLGREDDAYHATCVILMGYQDAAGIEDGGEGPETAESGILLPGPEAEEVAVETPEIDVDRVIQSLPVVQIQENAAPSHLSPSRFLEAMITRVLDVTPVNLHEEARRRREVPGQ